MVLKDPSVERATRIGLSGVNADVLLNALLFQCLWFSVMAFDQALMELFVFALLVQFLYRKSYANSTMSLRLPLGVLTLGIFIDACFTSAGLFAFPIVDSSASWSHSTFFGIPFWLVGMWLGFVLTIQHSLQWLRERSYIYIIGFAIFGPVSYIAGRSFGVIQFDNNAVMFISIAWALVAWVSTHRPNAIY